MIETRPPFSERIASFFLVLMFSVIGAIPLLLLISYLYLNTPATRPPAALMICTLIPGFLFGIFYGRKTWNKVNWRLTDSELICGTSGKMVFPLRSVEKVIVGLPTGTVGKVLKRDKPGSVVSAGLDVITAINPSGSFVRRAYVPLRENSLLLCFADGSWLPLSLYLTPNGAQIMETLKERFKDRLVHNYEYSPEETRLLRSRDINELIPAPQ